MNFGLFTDWTQTDPHYFWGRGAIWGIVFATLLWKLTIPKLRAWIENRRWEKLNGSKQRTM